MTADGSGLRRLLAPAPLAALVLSASALFLNLDLVTGRATPVYRDLGTTQRPARALAPALGRAALNPHASFGQPYFGNPNLVLAYPFPRAPRYLGLHLVLHLAIGLAGAYLFFRRLVRSADAALLGALAFGLSGYVLSSTAFLNATTTLAWLPWLLYFAVGAQAAEGRILVRCAFGIAVSASLLVLGGEPALAGLALLVAGVLVASSPVGTRAKAFAAFGSGLAGAALLLAPWLLEVGRASAFSSRRVRGFSWEEFAAVGFHPLRLLETPFPFLFGDPARLVSGGFWGFGATQGNPPYLAWLGFGVLPLALAVLFVVSARRNEGRLWIGAAALGLAASAVPWIPGARAAYGALPFLHVVRYPVKATVVVFLAVAALAALAVDRLVVEGALPRFRIHASRALGAFAAAFAAVSLWGRLSPSGLERLLHRGWDPTWASDPRAVLAPVVARIPVQAALAAGALVLLAVVLRQGGETRGRRLLLVAAGAELLLQARPLMPRLPSSLLADTPPLVARAAAIPGRVYERASKDLDPVRRGLFGRAPDDGIAAMALAQHRQAWSLSGAPFGLRYAYDPDPDGSYTYLNRIVSDVVKSRDWPRRLKWLRSAGVGSIIADDVPADLPGLAPVFTDGLYGIPATLFRVTDPLPGLRRCTRVVPVDSVSEAVSVFEVPEFDPATDVVVAGKNAESLAAGAFDETARTRLVAETADRLVVETTGATPSVLHIDRSYAPRVRAAVNERSVALVVANVHLVGVPVPAGTSRVVIDLAP